MGLLDGGLKTIAGTAFGPIFLAGTLHVSTRTHDAGGSIVETFADVAVKAIAIDLTERQRAEGGYSEKQVSILVLQAGIAAEINANSQITAKKPGQTSSVRYLISPPITQDPAGATWSLIGTPV